MNKQEVLDKIQNEINHEQNHLSEIDENDYVERGITLGRINGLLTAKLIVWNLEVK